MFHYVFYWCCHVKVVGKVAESSYTHVRKQKNTLVKTHTSANLQVLGVPPPLPSVENFEMRKLPSESTTVNLQMFSSEIVSHYGITQLPPVTPEGELQEGQDDMEMDEVTYKRECIVHALRILHETLCVVRTKITRILCIWPTLLYTDEILRMAD